MSDGTFYVNPSEGLPEGEEHIRMNAYWRPEQRLSKNEPAIFIHNYLGASDYSSNDGGIVRANIAAFREQISDDYLGQLFWTVSGDFGYNAIAVRADVLDTDSALYAAGDEELIDAANQIREIIDTLDSYPILDEDAHSQQEMNEQDTQFPEAAADIYISTHRNPLKGIGIEDGKRYTLPFLITAALWPDLSKEADERLEEDGLEGGLAGVQAFYNAFSDLFGVYPEIEGSGDNLAVLFRFEQFIAEFARAIQALRGSGERPLIPGIVPILGGMIVDAIFSEKPWEHFNYNSKIYNALRTGREIDRMLHTDQTAYAIFSDSVEANPGRGILLAFEGKLIATAQQGPLAGVRRKRR